MSKKKEIVTAMVAKNRNKALPCSTPEHYNEESPSRDSDSIYDSDAASPVPFLCTQDGAEGETDVVWNFYTPKSGMTTNHSKNITPVSRKGKKVRPKLIGKQIPKLRPIKPSQKRNELFQELLELNKNVHNYISKKLNNDIDKPHSEEDIFSDHSDSSPKGILRSQSNCLRKNILSSKFGKAETETGLESDDSMNECLLKASQVVENIIDPEPTPVKMRCLDVPVPVKRQTEVSVNIGNDSMDAILSNIQLESSNIAKKKGYDSPKICNDSFDNILEDLNDSALERLSQMPLQCGVKKTPNMNKTSNWNVKEIIVHDSSPTSSTIFNRHNSMPESPSYVNKPCASGMGFGRYKSMPFNKSIEKNDSPIKCTPDEIEKKHKQAREKLLAKRLLPFTQQPSQSTSKKVFQPKVSSSKAIQITQKIDIKKKNASDSDLRSIIEKKRQEALLRLRKKHHVK